MGEKIIQNARDWKHFVHSIFFFHIFSIQKNCSIIHYELSPTTRVPRLSVRNLYKIRTARDCNIVIFAACNFIIHTWIEKKNRWKIDFFSLRHLIIEMHFLFILSFEIDKKWFLFWWANNEYFPFTHSVSVVIMENFLMHRPKRELKKEKNRTVNEIGRPQFNTISMHHTAGLCTLCMLWHREVIGMNVMALTVKHFYMII